MRVRAIRVPMQAYLAWAFDRLRTHRDRFGPKLGFGCSIENRAARPLLIVMPDVADDIVAGLNVDWHAY